MVNILTGIPFDTPKRLHHREDEGALEFPSSVGSRARGLLALKACNWRAASGGGWKNPYITDGLVAMWDAEWNEAGGVHNASLMQLNDVMGNLGPVPVMELGDFWMKMDTGVTFSGSTYPALSGMINSEGYREITYEGYTSFDPLVQEVTGNRYAFSSRIFCKKADGSSTVTSYAGYGLNANGMCMNMRGFFAPITSTVRGDDGAWRTYSCSTLNKSGSDSVAYLDGVEYGRYTWSSGSVYSHIQQIGLEESEAIKDYVKSSCLRIYGRALSVDEVAHNARVDRERFGGRL